MKSKWKEKARGSLSTPALGIASLRLKSEGAKSPQPQIIPPTRELE